MDLFSFVLFKAREYSVTLLIQAHFINLLPPSNGVRKQKKKYFRGSFEFSVLTI